MTLVIAAGPAALRRLRPLIRAHERVRDVRVVEPSPAERLGDRLDGAEGVLLVAERRRSPGTLVPGPFLADPSGRPVPVGVVPDLDPGLDAFAKSAARVARREGPAGPLAVLGQRETRYLRLAAWMELYLALDGPVRLPVLRWTAERITRDDLAHALRHGLGAAVYFGHGRPGGWQGYHGLRARHLVEVSGEPLGAILSVTCLTASRWRVGLSFAESVVIGGVAAAALGAVSDVRHKDNLRFMIGLAEALRGGERRLGPAILAAAPPTAALRAPYRIVGDPLALLVGTAEGARRAVRVFAPAPDFGACA